MSSPSLLSLPAEVRLNIYSYLFDDVSLHIDQHTASPHPKQQQKPALAPILRTCRYLRDEASPSYFSKVKVHVAVRKAVPCTSLVHWLESIGEHNVRLLRNITIRWDNYVDINLELNKSGRPSSKDIIASMQTQVQPTSESSKAETPVIELPSIMLGEEFLFEAPRINPTTSIQTGQKHTLTMKGISDDPGRKEFWAKHGTAEFCNTLSTYLSPRIGATLENRPLYLSSIELVHFVEDACNHAASLRWLWYW